MFAYENFSFLNSNFQQTNPFINNSQQQPPVSCGGKCTGKCNGNCIGDCDCNCKRNKRIEHENVPQASSYGFSQENSVASTAASCVCSINNNFRSPLQSQPSTIPFNANYLYGGGNQSNCFRGLGINSPFFNEHALNGFVFNQADSQAFWGLNFPF